MTGRILIAGAGPSGLLCAVELAARGVPCRVVDRRPGPAGGSRCPTLWQRSLRVLASAGVSVEALRRAGTALERKRFLIAGADAEVDLRSGDGPFDAPLLVRQEDLEHLLLERLRALGGAVEYGVELLEVRRDGGGASRHGAGAPAVAVLRGPDGVEEAPADRVVCATGAAGRVAGVAGPADVAPVGMRWLLADVEVAPEDAPAPGVEHILRDRAGHGGLVPLPGGGHRLFLALPDDPAGADRRPSPAEVVEAARRSVGVRLTGEPGAIWAVRPRSWVAPAFVDGPVVLLGDAARSFPMPVHGLNTGLQEAAGLGWKLAAAASAPAGTGAELLATYDAERRAAAERIRDRAERVLGYGSTVPLEVIRDRLLARVFELRTEPDTVHAPGPLTAAGGALAGHRAPEGVARAAGPGWYVALLPGTDPARPDRPGAEAGRAAAGVAARFGLPLVACPAAPAPEGVPDAGARLLLVRPDGHVSFDGAPGEPAELERHLEGVRRFL
ncbi:FAD-dependent monooxygenase [Streptomyces sp. NPDC014656]|uniref:FAD-dependent monooxygenase n=1 Tax=Streptomyces sp. NPDC014656 TaxID=3364878 RepID=UPI0036FBC898